MTYPIFTIKDLRMTTTEINAHYLADCRRVGIMSDTPWQTLNEVTWDLANNFVEIVLEIDVRRAN